MPSYNVHVHVHVHVDTHSNVQCICIPAHRLEQHVDYFSVPFFRVSFLNLCANQLGHSTYMYQ